MAYIGTYKFQKTNKAIYLCLSNIYGIGSRRALNLHLMSGGHLNQLFCQSSKRQQKLWFYFMVKQYRTGGGLRLLKRANIKRLKYIKCYRGLRHYAFLPVRGQRTHSNHRTSRYLMSGTWYYVPNIPVAKLKKISKYVRHKKFLVEKSNIMYGKLLQRHFISLQKNKRYFKNLTRQGKLAQFAKLAKQKNKK